MVAMVSLPKLPKVLPKKNGLCFTHEDKAILALVYNQSEMTQKELALEWGWMIDRVEYYLNKIKNNRLSGE